ncbi:MAG: hypothetical protein JNM33_07275 [Rubrivivax sp.]|nr:hypothetical protein [Rubrivivax sp.]
MKNLRLPVWAAFVFTLLLGLAGPAAAQEEPPGRVGRIADLQGSVSWFDHDEGRWAPAERNRPVTGSDRLATGPGGRAELRIGSTVLRLAEGSEIELQRLDDERVVVALQSGSFALRLKNREAAEETRVLTAEVRLAPQRAGHYRFDRIDDSTVATVWRGDLRVEGPGGWGLTDGQRLELFRDRSGELRGEWGTPPDDAFAAWALRDDAREGTTVSTRYVSPEMTGVEDLDRHGRWSSHPEHGAIWFPLAVAADWAPYRDGRWVWVRPWGWTWVDAAPWGFAPFHYGRWTLWNGRWGWLPGTYVARPVFAPALVAPRGGPGVSVTIGIGSPPRHWEPLGPREHYRPWHRPAPVVGERPRPQPPAWQAPPVQTAPPGQPLVHEPRQHLPRQPWRGERTAEPPRQEAPRHERPRQEPPRHEPPRQEHREPPRAPVREAPRENVRPAPAPVPRPDEAARRPEPKPGKHERSEAVR